MTSPALDFCEGSGAAEGATEATLLGAWRIMGALYEGGSSSGAPGYAVG